MTKEQMAMKSAYGVWYENGILVGGVIPVTRIGET